jgi:transposase
VTKEGIPVRVWCWPGNANDQTILPGVKDDIRGWRLGRIIAVVDRGFSSADNLAYLRRGGGHFIAGMRMRDGNPLVEQVLSRQGRYQQVKDNLRVKEVSIESTGVRYIICHNPEQADRDRIAREDAVSRLETELARIRQARERGKANKKTSTNTKRKAEAAHTKAECALRDHPALGRWLRQQPNARLAIDRAKVKAEERLDGKYLIATSDPHISAEDAALGYKNLLEAERGFRDLKSSLLLRPVFHRLEHRIRAHVLLCWLALLLIRVAERRTSMTWRRIAIELGRVHAVTLTGTAGSSVHITPLTTTQAGILRDCQITPPSRITALDPS